MKISDLSIQSNMDRISKAATTLSKLGIFAGGICIISYSLEIGYFPQDISIGDGILFLMAAACFGIVYIFFVACLVSFGVFCSPVIRRIYRLAVSGVNLFRKYPKDPEYDLAPFTWVSILFSIFALVIIIGFGKRDPTVYWNLPLLSIGLYTFYSAYLAAGRKLKHIYSVQTNFVHTNEKETIAKLGDPERLRQNQLVSIAVILIAPLLFGHVSGQLLDAAMRFAKIRLEHPTIYVKSPYALMLPKGLISRDRGSLAEYTRFDGTVVLFNGFGKNTVVSFPDGANVRTLKIPNDQIIVE